MPFLFFVLYDIERFVATEYHIMCMCVYFLLVNTKCLLFSAFFLCCILWCFAVLVWCGIHLQVIQNTVQEKLQHYHWNSHVNYDCIWFIYHVLLYLICTLILTFKQFITDVINKLNCSQCNPIIVTTNYLCVCLLSVKVCTWKNSFIGHRNGWKRTHAATLN